MRPFLRQVVDHYYESASIEKTVFIFPNRRSLAFFRKYLADAVRESSTDRPLLEPRLLTISDFFGRLSGRTSSDRITLLLKLYDCYAVLNPKAESLDDFIYWGDVLLGDFDDVDKYLVDARQLFRNISDIKAIQDDYSHLSEEQTRAIERLGAVKALAEHFTPARRKTVEAGRPDVKENFLMIWNILFQLYESFRKSLDDAGLAYEGMVFRSIVDRLVNKSIVDLLSPVFGQADRFVFVGLNALNECEKTVMKKMRDAGVAEFCWDFPGEMIRDKANAASHFMQTMTGSNLELFPNAFEPEDGGGKPRVNVVAVPSATGQAKLIPGLIESVPENQRALDFAVVLPDETMLMPVLNSIPDGIEKINITMGCPLATSEFSTLMREVLAMQLHLRKQGDSVYFNHKQVWAILSTGIMKSVMNNDERSQFTAIRKAAKFHIPQEDFGDSELFRILFRPVVTDQNAVDASQIASLADYLLEVVKKIAAYLRGRDSDDSGDEKIARQPLQLEFARQYYCCINALKDKSLAIRPQTWAHLVSQMIAGQSVPFIGEPLQGLQVMGPLETRALDFRHIVILNCSEGVFPRRSVSSSFIPPELRTAFGLPTYAYQDAVWAYYFYRMIARAENVWMIYDSRTEGLKSGEESRYIKQLRSLYGDKVDFSESIAKAPSGSPVREDGIAKTDEDIEKLRTMTYSASTIEKYLACQAQFYYYAVKGLRAENEVSDTLDPGAVGSICHTILEKIYGSSFADGGVGKVDEAFLESWMGREDEIKAMVHDEIRSKLNCTDVSGKNLIDAEIALRFILKVMERDIEIIRERKSPLSIVGVELKYGGKDAAKDTVEICGHKFKGTIDRLDSFQDGTVRVVDYKSGKDSPDCLGKPDVDHLFKGNTETKAAFQFYVYNCFVKSDKDIESGILFDSMYAMSDIFSHKVKSELANPDLLPGGRMEQSLTTMFAEMESKEIPFKMADEDSNHCKYCDYKVLCGRYPKKK